MNIGRMLLLMALVFLAGDAHAQALAQSFTDLQPLVVVGQRIIVHDGDGRRTAWRVMSLTGSQLEVQRVRWNFRSDRRIFTEQSVRMIEHRDSTWNGSLLGVGVGALVALLACNSTSNDPDDWSCLAWIPIAPAVGSFVGGAIDAAINRPLYVSPARRGVTLFPVIGRQRASIAAALRF